MSKIDLASGMRAGATHLFEVECIRGLAILLVFLFHAYGVAGLAARGDPGLLTSYVAGGNTGVTLFFVLSGFLLSLPWFSYAMGLRGDRPGLREYFVARCLRIVPLYWVAVVSATVFTGEWLVGARAAAFQFVGFEMFPYSVVWWTLATEVQFYLLLPLAWLGWLRGGVVRGLLVLAFFVWLAAYGYVFLVFPEPQTAQSFWLTKSLFGRLPAFLVGLAAAYLYLRLRPGTPAPGVHPLRQWLSLMVVAGLALVLALVLHELVVLGDRQAEWRWHIHHTWEALLWGALLLVILLSPPAGRRLLVNRTMAVTGKLSYSLYLVHVPILFYLVYPVRERLGMDAFQSSPLLYLVPGLALLGSLAVSAVSFRGIELPFLNLKHRVRG